MKTFHILLLSASLLGAVLSCEKSTPLSPLPAVSPTVENVGGTGILHVTVGTEGATKASLTGLDEKAVRSLQVFVFNAESGKRETDKFVSGNSLTITAPVGNKHVWAIVNHSRFADMPTETDLKNTVTDLSDNYDATNGINLIMAGEKDVEVTRSSIQVSVNVTRLASRIVLTKVTRQFADTYLSGCTFTIKDMYLKNVAGHTNFSLNKKNNNTDWDIIDPTLWYNKMRDENTSAVIPLLCDHDLNISCEEGVAKEIKRVWYTYPNPTSDDNNGATWSARHTRLVIHAEVTGYGNSAIQSYYTFTLPVLKRNCSYEISDITFTMLGKNNDDDDSVTDTGTASITLNVVDWDSSTALSFNM
jgi:hypothetical protein